jgi:hypothetical protein
MAILVHIPSGRAWGSAMLASGKKGESQNMGQSVKPQKTGRNERHSAAWGKRLGMMLVLTTGLAFGQSSNAVPQDRVARVFPPKSRI